MTFAIRESLEHILTYNENKLNFIHASPRMVQYDTERALTKAPPLPPTVS